MNRCETCASDSDQPIEALALADTSTNTSVAFHIGKFVKQELARTRMGSFSLMSLLGFMSAWFFFFILMFNSK